MGSQALTTIGFYYRQPNSEALGWEIKIKKWLVQKLPAVRVVAKNPGVLIVLGGDGTILEAARQYQKSNPLILGLNMGQVGFLASVRDPKDFLRGLTKFLKGNYLVAKRMMVEAEVVRGHKIVFSANALNEIAVQNLLGMVEIAINIEGDTIQYIRGTGAIVSTATGSTAYNLSAHGPIVMPEIECFIVSELMDHNLPSPSIVVKQDKKICLKIVSFRERGLLSISENSRKIDVILMADGGNVFPLQEKDEIHIIRSSKLIRFVELEKNYFFKSLKEKFGFR